MKVMVVAVHPDDETLGCGGTLLKHKANGDKIIWTIVTKIKDQKTYESRKREINKIKILYQFDAIEQLEFNTCELDIVSEGKLIDRFSSIMKEHQPEVIYLPFANDVHSDHRKVFNTFYSCTKNFRYPFIKKIMMMETISETEFVPALQSNLFNANYFIDISQYFLKKIEAFKIYESEIMSDFLPRSLSSIEALSRFRGSQIGTQYAEAFQILKEIN